ncbi:MAG: amidohydrolase [Candidatus Dormibacteraeota bacterium]|nr:amidohydrolase [Candidatus Dormibacteraeota bacterium]
MLRLTAPLTPTALRQAFTEAIDPEMIRDHSHETVIYRRALRMLASELDCAPTEEDVIRGREGVEPAAHANQLLKRSRTGLMILDHGFTGGDGMSQAEHSAAIEIPQREVIRLETAAEGVLASCDSVAEWTATVRSELRNAISRGAVGVKTIAAYRAGIRLREPDQEAADADFKALRARAAGGLPVRLEGEPLCHSLLLEAAKECCDLGVPLQVHCGFGDPDEDMQKANPLGLRRLFVGPQYAGLKVVLLHCYPFHREAAYLASVFPGVHMDLSLAIPLAAEDGARALREALGLCPTSKLLYATDATRFPEVYLVAAALHREALARAFGELVDGGWLTKQEAVKAGGQVLAGNARRIYKLP